MKTRISVLFVAGLISAFAVQALGHGFEMDGGENSLAGLLSAALFTAASSDSEVTVDEQDDTGNLRLTREDDFGYVECLILIHELDPEYYECLTVEKHGKPLRELDTYKRGTYMNLAGGSTSNASVLYRALFQSRHDNELLKVRELSTGKVIVERSGDGADPAVWCSSIESEYECRIEQR